MKQQHKFSLSYYLMVFFSIIMLESIFFSGAAVKEISYSKFRDLLDKDRVQSVIVEQNRIFGLEKTSTSAKGITADERPVFQPNRRKAPWNFNFGLFGRKDHQPAEQQFVVTRLDDPHLIADLQSHGVDYRGKIESHWLTDFLSNWIVPLVFFVLLGRFLARRMGKGAGFLDAGRNKARIYAVDPSQKVSFRDVAGIVHSMLTVYGMSEHMPNRSLVEKPATPFLGQGPSTQRRSESLETLIDGESQAIIDAAYQSAKQILSGHRHELEAMAELLLEKEKIDAQDILRILGPGGASQKVQPEQRPKLAAALQPNDLEPAFTSATRKL